LSDRVHLLLEREDKAVPAWRIAGTYYESCNCEAICPCRRVNGRPGGRSTYGICRFLLSWRILAGFYASQAGLRSALLLGEFGGLDLAGRKVAMAGLYDDDEPGSPWRVALYIDDQASPADREALQAIFAGRAGGNIAFTAHIAEIAAVRTAAIDLDHQGGFERIAVRDFAFAAVERLAGQDGVVTCGIPGHDHPGVESVAGSQVDDGPLSWSYEGRCGFATDFEYHS
jgi:hypothetical protein